MTEKCLFCKKELDEDDYQILNINIPSGNRNLSYNIPGISACKECLMDYDSILGGLKEVNIKKEPNSGYKVTGTCISCGKEAKGRYFIVLAGLNKKSYGSEIFTFRNLIICLKCAKKEKSRPQVSFSSKKDIPSNSIPEDDFIGQGHFSDFSTFKEFREG